MPHSRHDVDYYPNDSGFADDLVEIAAAMRSLSQRSHDEDGVGGPLDRLVAVAVERVPGARSASISMLRGGRFTTAAATDEHAVRADVLQYEMESGPCVNAVLEDGVNLTGEVSTDPRWGAWGQRVNAELGVNSVLSQRLHPQAPSGVIAGLNIYSDTRDAFDHHAVGIAQILAIHGALVLSELLASQRAATLSKALQSNREIGVAMGILVNRHQITSDQAFEVLRVTSQNTNRKLVDIAADVARARTLTTHHLV